MSTDLAAAARLFDVANPDDAVIDTVERLLNTLKDARRARQQLARMPASDLRVILAHRAHPEAKP